MARPDHQPDEHGAASPLRPPTTTRALAAYAWAGALDHPRLDIMVGERTSQELPPIGFQVGRIPILSDDVMAIVRTLAPSHLRVDVCLSAGDWMGRLRDAVSLVSAVNAALEVGIAWGRDLEVETLRDLVARLPAADRVARVLVLGDGKALPRGEVLASVRREIKVLRPEVPVFTAAVGHFAMLNRDWEQLADADGVAYGIQAQVHASDDLSLIESLDGQSATVIAARVKGGRPVTVSAVAFGPGGPDDPPDPRWPALFGAGWTIGSLAALSGAGAASLTYQGLIGAAGPVLAPVAADGAKVSPAFHVLADVLEMRPAQVVATTLREDLPATVLALASDDTVRVMIANLSAREVLATVSGLGATPVAVRCLDADSSEIAGLSPGRFRSSAEQRLPAEGVLSVVLGPFALAALTQARG